VRSDPERLRAIPLFRDLSDDELETVASWLAVEDVSAGKRLTLEGGSGYQFYVIESGTAEVRHKGALIASLGPGDFFGEMAILGEGRRSADVVATSPMTLLAMFGTSFRQLQATWPKVAEEINSAMARRLREISADPARSHES
jgi:CRP-like cAMP-binding protein